MVVAARRVRPPGAAWNGSAPWTSSKQVHWWCDSPPKSRDIVKDLRRNILLRHQKVDWSEDLTTEFILLRGSRLQILFLHTRTIRKPLILGVQKCGCVGIGYLGDRNIRARSLKNGSILYEDFELRNEFTVTFLIEGIFQKSFYF